MLRYRRLERGRNSPSWYGLWADQYGNVYRRVRIWHPGFWLFVMRSPMFDGERWRALKTYIKNRREYLYEESVKRTKGESHRSLLPRMLHAAKVRRQVILLARLEEQVLPLARTRDENYEAFQKRDEALKKAKEKRDPAHGEWQLAMSTVLGAQDRVKRAQGPCRAEGRVVREADWEARRVRMKQERERGLAFSQVLREKFQAMTPTIEELSGQRDNRGEDEEQGRR